jgi:hypothetical protein
MIRITPRKATIFDISVFYFFYQFQDLAMPRIREAYVRSFPIRGSVTWIESARDTLMFAYANPRRAYNKNL